MAEIDSLGSNVYYAGVQNATNEALKKNRKTEETKSTKKLRFGDILHKTSSQENAANVNGVPPEIASMPVEEAALYLKDVVDMAGNDLAEEINEENIKKFKAAVSQFVKFVVSNNYEVKSHRRKNCLGKDVMVASRTNFFSNYSLPPHKIDPRYKIEVINKKLAELTTATIENQKSNLLILAQVDEIKGLIIDLIDY